MGKYLALLLAVLLLGACAPQTTVILLPMEGEAIGEVAVKTSEVTTIVDQPYGSTTVGWLSSLPSVVQAQEPENVEREFEAALRAHPPKVLSFTLYFASDSTIVNQQAQRVVSQIIAAIKEHKPVVAVNITGHTDSTGSKQYNSDLSLRRAKVIAQLLAPEVGPDTLHLYYFGENDLLVPTYDNVSEPRNRRVEVMIL